MENFERLFSALSMHGLEKKSVDNLQSYFCSQWTNFSATALPPPTTEKIEKYCSKSQVMLGWLNNEISSNDTVSVGHRAGQIKKILYKLVAFFSLYSAKYC
jgi:hypothetical protein